MKAKIIFQNFNLYKLWKCGYNISNRKRLQRLREGSMNNSMKKNIRHFFLLTALAAGTIHLVNRFIDMTAEMEKYFKDGKRHATITGRTAVFFIPSAAPVLRSFSFTN